MFINKAEGGSNNLCGERIAQLRKAAGISQRVFAERLQVLGLDIEKNAVQRIECGKRFVTDIELVIICKALKTSPNELLKFEQN
jgi:transcriptional regulator with XRE-family HTH domain